ncbi:YlbF family regulator [Planctomycetota bacterium]|nr:YlbF family regulator [Planctomycetota bacterium]
MATTEQILEDAKKLGKLIKEHPAAQKMDKAVEALQADIDSQRLANDYNRMAQTIAEKEQQGQPVEVDEKHKMAELHKQIIMNKVLSDLQMAQMDYSDLMRKIDTAMSGEIAPEPTAPPADDQNDSGESPIIQ